MSKMQKKVNVVGAGMAGTETAWMLAQHGVKVHLHEMKPKKYSPAHKLEGFAELVCSNSLGSTNEYSAPRLLKSEMEAMGSLILEGAYRSEVPSGNSLGVDREKLSHYVTEKLSSHPNIEIVRDEFTTIQPNEITVIATGPLTSDALSAELAKHVGADTLYFYDSISPIIDSDSIDYTKTFFASRYEEEKDDYLNCPMNKEQYDAFVQAILAAEKVPVREFEEMKCFEACMPIEVLAERGHKTLSFGPMKPVGLTDPKTGRWAHAIVQLRRENNPTTMYNMVGFQTRMKWGDQKKVFQTIPGLENAEFIRMGSLHRNTYIDSPNLLNRDLFLEEHPDVAIAGQLTGVEGYVDSAAMGMMVGMAILHRFSNVSYEIPPTTTAIGALIEYITTPKPKKHFSPMNINFGLLPPLETEKRMKGKEKKEWMVKRAHIDFEKWKSEVKKKIPTFQFVDQSQSVYGKKSTTEHRSEV